MKISYTPIYGGMYHLHPKVRWSALGAKGRTQSETKEALLLRTTLAFLEGDNHEQ